MRATNGGGSGTGGDLGVAAVACAAGGAGIYGAAQTSQTGPIIAGVVAIIVALVTWYATDRRQSKALAAERQRLQQQLEAEHDRHRERLLHERRIASLEEARSVMDTTLAQFSALLSALLRYEVAAERIRDLPRTEEPSEDDWAELATARSDVTTRVLPLFKDRHVLAVRAGREHAVAEAFAHAVRAARYVRNQLPAVGERPTAELIDKLIEARKLYDARLEQLIDRMHEELETLPAIEQPPTKPHL